MLHLKRFPRLGEKCSDSVSFPLIGFDMAPYTSTHSSTLYDCVAMCLHHGIIINSGHYTALSKRGGHWYHFDDGLCPKQVDAAFVASAGSTKANLVFYASRTLQPGALCPEVDLQPATCNLEACRRAAHQPLNDSV